MNPAMAAVIGAGVTGAVAIAVAIINVVVGRTGRRADIADKVSQAWDPVFERMDKDIVRLEEKCDECVEALAEATSRAKAAENRADAAERRADSAELRADRNDRTNAALIDAWNAALPLLAADNEATKYLRATIRAAEHARYENTPPSTSTT